MPIIFKFCWALHTYQKFKLLGKTFAAGIEKFRTIRKGQFENCEAEVINEIDFVAKLFQDAA